MCLAMKNYNRISVFSHDDFDVKMYRLGLDDSNVEECKNFNAFISIIGSNDSQKYYLEDDERHWFKINHENVLNVEFDDIEEDELLYKGVNFKGITNEQSEQIVDFIEKNKGKNFFLHCRAGRSRSAAICRYILDMYGEEYGYNEKESCRKENPCMTPNINVLTKLKRTYYKKFNIYDE